MVSTDRVACICAAQRLRSQETLSSDSIQGACADVRHSTHTGHSTDRPSHARVAESCCSFYSITSSYDLSKASGRMAGSGARVESVRTRRPHLNRSRRVLRRNMWRLRTHQNANKSRAGLHARSYGYMGWDCGLRRRARGDFGPWQHALCTPPVPLRRRGGPRDCREIIAPCRDTGDGSALVCEVLGSIKAAPVR